MPTKQTLVILGTHPNGLKTFDWSRTDCEIWMFNEAPNVKTDNGELLYPRTDAVFQMHHEAIWKNPKNRIDESHYNWLTSDKAPTVYMQETYKEVPKSVKYPIKEVLSLVKNIRMVINGKEKRFKYFSSTPDFALALVAEMWKKGIRYGQVEIHGIELETESEYNYQRPGFGFWIGYLAALGVKITLHSSIFNGVMYGYEGDVAITSKYLEKRIADLTNKLGDGKQRYKNEAQLFLNSLSELIKQDISKSVEKELNEITKRNEKAGIIVGRIKEDQRYLDKAQAMEKASGASVFAMGEFEQTLHLHKSQYDQVYSKTLNLNFRISTILKKLLNLKKGSRKRRRALDEIGNLIAEMMNKNMLLLYISGAIEENHYFLNSVKLSYSKAGGGR